MPRPRKHNRDLPPRVYERHGAVYYCAPVTNKWTRLGKAWDFESRAAWNALVSEGAHECRLSVADLLAAYLKHRRAHLKRGTLLDYERDAGILGRVFGPMAPRDVTPGMVQKYLDTCAEADRGVRGNREIALLSAAFNFGIPREWCSINPCAHVQRNPESPGTRRVTLDDLDRFLVWARAPKNGHPATRAQKMIAVSCELAYLTAQAKSDIIALHRSAIDHAEGGGIHFVRGKTGKRVCVEWSPRLRAAVATAQELHGTVAGLTLIANHQGQRYTVHGWSAIFHRVMNDYIAQGGPRFGPHDLRAGGATRLLESGETASNTTGHSLESTLKKHYDRRLERRGKPAA